MMFRRDDDELHCRALGSATIASGSNFFRIELGSGRGVLIERHGRIRHDLSL